MERAERGLEEAPACCRDETRMGRARVAFITQTADENLPGRSDMRGKLARLGQGESMAY